MNGHLSPGLVEWLGRLTRQFPPAFRHKRLGVAVSGGADSVALLLALLALRESQGIELTVLHVDHALRPESEADAKWVETLAARLALPFQKTQLPAPDVRERQEEGLESWARKQRLVWFARVFHELNLQAIALGHHQGDQAETVLWRVMRGCSTAGLGGLRPVRRLQTPEGPVRLWRPLLHTAPEILRCYLRELGQDWREDPTNATTTFFRNRVRHQILPYLSEFQPKIVEHLSRLGETINDVHRSLADRARLLLRRAPAGILPWAGKPTGAVLMELLRQWWFREFPTGTYQFNQAMANRLKDLLVQRRCGRQLVLGSVRIVRTSIGLENLTEAGVTPANVTPSLAFRGYTPHPEDTPRNPETHERTCSKTTAERIPLMFDEPTHWQRFQLTLHRSGNGSSPNDLCIWAAGNLVTQGLQIGHPQSGDRFTPARHSRSRSLARWFIDQKIPRHHRPGLCVIACGSEVIWVPEHDFRSVHLSDTPGPGKFRISLTRNLPT